MATKDFFKKKLIFKKSADDNKSMKHYSACKELSQSNMLEDKRFLDTSHIFPAPYFYFFVIFKQKKKYIYIIYIKIQHSAFLKQHFLK